MPKIITFLVMCVSCISNGPAGLPWHLPLESDSCQICQRIGWRGSGLWSEISQHTVEPTLASGLAHAALSNVVISTDVHRVLRALSGHSCPSPIETGLAGRDCFYTENVFTLSLACTVWADSMSGKQSSLSLSYPPPLAKQARQCGQ